MTDQLATFPMTRAATCPFDPPPALREREPISRVRIWNGTSPWLVTDYADQRALLADPRLSSEMSRPGFPAVSAAQALRASSRLLINMDNPDHDRYRRMLTRDFMVKRVEAMRPKVQGIVDVLIDELLDGPKPADLVEAFGLPVPSLVICELLGVPYADHAFFQRASSRLLAGDIAPEEGAAAQQEITDYLFALVGEKNATPGADLISRLVIEQLRPGTMTAEEVANMATLLLVAGHETTANMISLGTVALLRHPEQLDEVRHGDLKLIANAVEELLRYLNIVHSGRRRQALEDIEIRGTLIKAGDGVIIANNEGSRDESAFPGNPDELDIHREARHHLAFGYGIHQCLGQPLARMELQVVYSTLYRRIPTLALAVPFEELRFKNDMLIYGLHELPVTW